jgi:hypothetical protein
VNQISLNLIAITIFALVMSSLLGPLINLSPVVPAAAAFGLLFIGAVDTFNLQGRLSSVVLDWLANTSPEHRARVVRHEAGHFLVAELLGIPITGYTLNAWEAMRQGRPGQGGVSFDIQELEAELETGQLSSQLVDRYCTVWMAGIAAETLIYGNAEGGMDDRQTIRTLWMQLKRSPAEADLKQRWGALQAKTMLETHADAYGKLLEAMEQRTSVENCQTILREALQSTGQPTV